MAARASSEAEESVWVRRLAKGAGFCCALGSGPGQAVEGFWRDVFSTTRPGSRVLEIGCGSGDVSIWAAEAGRGLQVVASDIHDRPELVRAHPGVSFLGRARAEALPLDSGSFDMIVSNFAFEYAADRRAAVSEVARVLRPGGGAALVLHSADSAVSDSSRSFIQTHERLLAAGVPDRVRRAAALRADHLSRRKLLKEVLKTQPAFASPPTGLSAAYFELAQRLLKADPAAREELERVEEMAPRLADMSRAQLDAALDRPALAALADQFGAQGIAVHATEITGTYETALVQKVGWLALLTKGR